ncbi:MAG TPA: diguanylate cyclase [Duganella sp.]|jgi:diguanylate cyclase (GGDEF)-like protein
MKILIADDDPVSLLYLEDALQDWGYEVVAVPDGQRAHDILHGKDGPMLAILDWMMPGMDGIDLCRTIRANANATDSYTYIIMLTARRETEFVVEAMNAGADDFISKPFDVAEFEVRVRAGKRICELEQALRLKATHDALTGVYNRGAIMDILQKAVARHEREQRGLALLFADLDHFKHINDKYGHPAGDAVLREVTSRMGRAMREYDSLGRYGGEELMLVLPACTADHALVIAERIRTAICAEPVDTGDQLIPTSISIGVATLAENSTWSSSQLIQQADSALYQAKEAGRNRVAMAVAAVLPP